MAFTIVLLLVAAVSGASRFAAAAFSPPSSPHRKTCPAARSRGPPGGRRTLPSRPLSPRDDDDFSVDDADFFDDDADLIFRATSAASARLATDEEDDDDRADLSGSSSRRFSLGRDLLLDSFVGSMGFDEVTDWDYYLVDVDEDGNRDPRGGDRRSVPPNPLDPSQPRRTRTSSGGVVRVFRGELTGRLGAALRSRGADPRVLVKEFGGDAGADLAAAELRAAVRMQEELVRSGGDGDASAGAWSETAAARRGRAEATGDTRDDDANLARLLSLLGGGGSGGGGGGGGRRARHVGVLGTLDLSDFESDPDLDPNEWYRALKVAPPKPGSAWIVYEYAGLSTLSGYSRPAAERVAALPPRRGVFGNPMPPPPLPQWRDRANYVVRGVLRGALEALATTHGAGVVHRSIGRSSVVLSSVGQDKAEASGPYATVPSRLIVKLSDFGFSAPLSEAYADEQFRARARSFGLPLSGVVPSKAAENFAVAEDLHAMGFVFLGVLLTSLAVTPTPEYALPNTDEDGLQRLLGDIFSGDFGEFREYVEAEECWSNVVGLLDEDEGAGWDLLEDMCLARERAAELEEGDVGTTARELLENPIFATRR